MNDKEVGSGNTDKNKETILSDEKQREAIRNYNREQMRLHPKNVAAVKERKQKNER